MRLDETVVRRIDSLARLLRMSKKRVVEQAINQFAAGMGLGENGDVFEQTSGAWRRKESAGQLVEKARRECRRSMRQGERQ